MKAGSMNVVGVGGSKRRLSSTVESEQMMSLPIKQCQYISLTRMDVDMQTISKKN